MEGKVEADQPSSSELYYPVSPFKFILISFATFYVYPVYWAYKNWKYIKRRDDSKSWPAVRAIFLPFTYYGIISDVKEKHTPEIVKSETVIAGLVIMYFTFNIFWRFPDPYSILGYFSLLFLLPTVIAIRDLNEGQETLKKNSRHGFLNWTAYILGGTAQLAVLLLIFNVFPSGNIVEGNRLWNGDITFLQEQGLLDQNEEIKYIYSSDPFSYQNDGNYFTDRGVASYGRDPDSGRLIAWKSRYSDIANITTSYSDSWVDPTVIRIKTKDNQEYELWIASEGKQDNHFVGELMRLWKNSRQPKIE